MYNVNIMKRKYLNQYKNINFNANKTVRILNFAARSARRVFFYHTFSASLAKGVCSTLQKKYW